MTLIPTLKARLAQPSHVVDISGLKELRGIESKGGTLVIGAGTRHHEVATIKRVRETIPALSFLAGRIGDPQVRNCGTIGGSVANNDPAADYPAAVLGLGATIVTDRREIAADDYFKGIFATALELNELIVRIVFPVRLNALRKICASGVGLRDGRCFRRGNGARRARRSHGCGAWRIPLVRSGSGARKKDGAGIAGASERARRNDERRHTRLARIPREPGERAHEARSRETRR